MRRRRTILSLPGLIILAFLLAGLGVALWLQGGLAFSPGALSDKRQTGVALGGFASHAEFERECRRCHQPLVSLQAELCIECHTTIVEQIRANAGLHARLQNVAACQDCHSEHRGRSFDPGRDALDDFDHSLTSFSLIWHQVDYSMSPLGCTSCHLEDEAYSVSLLTCSGCHGGHDREFMVRHLQEFGEACLDCHDGIDRMTDFNHNATDFPLLGKHLDARCAACHLEGNFELLSVSCESCHQEPAIHLGVFHQDCAACHNPQAWQPALLEGSPFEHARQTGFSLEQHAKDFAGQGMSCTACHLKEISQIDLSTCIACHSDEDAVFMETHRSLFGEACLDCHDGVDRMHDFDHSLFPLEGRHAEVDCAACHVDRVFAGTSKDCVDCHAEPEIHAGFFGLQCQLCHTTSAWAPARLQDHRFPLDHGGQGEIACQTCHPTVYSEYTCYGCHEHEPGKVAEEHREEEIPMNELQQCATCHPTGQEDEAEGGD